MTNKKMQYIEYINQHINNVQLIWKNIQPLLKGDYFIDDYIWHDIWQLIAWHDITKHSNQEFGGYRQWFYPEELEEKNKESFNHAWNHHQKANPHHWQYWIMWKPNGSIALDMPFKYMFEMLCDWSAMSLKFGDTPTRFFNKTKHQMLLHRDTMQGIENWLPVFDKTVANIHEEQL